MKFMSDLPEANMQVSFKVANTLIKMRLLTAVSFAHFYAERSKSNPVCHS